MWRVSDKYKENKAEKLFLFCYNSVNVEIQCIVLSKNLLSFVKMATEKGSFCVMLDSKILLYDKYTAVFSSSQALKSFLFRHHPGISGIL